MMIDENLAENIASNVGDNVDETTPIIRNVKTSTGEDADELNLFLPSHLKDLTTEEDFVKLYEGPMVLHSDSRTIEGHGEITMQFSPRVALKFFFNSSVVPMDVVMSDGSNESTILEMVATGRSVEIAFTTKHISSAEEFSARGNIKGLASFETLKSNGKPESIGRVKFYVLNFQNYSGEYLFQPNSARNFLWSGRTRTTFGDWIFTLDAFPDVEQRHKHIEERGGCVITHAGDLRRHDGKLFAPKDAEDVLGFLYWLLSFTNGARCGFVLEAGFRYLDVPLWEMWTPYITDEGTPGTNWFPKHRPNEALSIAEGAWQHWKNKNKRAWFTRSISIYTDSSRNTSGTEIELAKAQMALELLTWVVLREEQSVISEDGLNKLEAADRLRLMLSWCGIPLTIHPKLTNLALVFRGVNGADGPQVVTEIRNSTIHPTKKNLEKLNNYDFPVRFEAWWLTLWYVEMVLLKLFGYDGSYDNRTDLGRWAGGYEKVPWAK